MGGASRDSTGFGALEAGHSKLVLWDNPEGWGGEGSGRGFRMGEHMYTRD